MSILFSVSYVLLWMIVILLSVALFILYSHVGERFLLKSREGFSLHGPELTKRIEPHVLSDVSGFRITLGGSSPKPRLVIYVSTNCEPCRDLLNGLPEFVERYGRRVDTVLVCKGEVAEARAFAAGLPTEILVCVDENGDIAKSYHILMTPYALSLDGEGVLRFKGLPRPDLPTLSHFVMPLLQGEPEQSRPRLHSPKVVAQS